MFPASEVSAPLDMRTAMAGMCSKEFGIDSSRTFTARLPFELRHS
jgi:hypothetical protein